MFLGIAVQAYAPIGSPGRINIDSNDPILLEDPVINEIATAHQASAAQVGIVIISVLFTRLMYSHA